MTTTITCRHVLQALHSITALCLWVSGIVRTTATLCDFCAQMSQMTNGHIIVQGRFVYCQDTRGKDTWADHMPPAQAAD